jgi:hypothetical protein
VFLRIIFAHKYFDAAFLKFPWEIGNNSDFVLPNNIFYLTKQLVSNFTLRPAGAIDGLVDEITEYSLVVSY